MFLDLIKAIVLGIVEGLTEFLPVSSTGHLLLVGEFLNADPARKEFWDTFSVLIQFGAILALLSIYFARLWRLALGMFSDPAARRFVIGVVVAFLPAAVIGALAHGFIKGVLFNVWIVCFTLIVGGAILLWVDSLDLKPRYDNAERYSLPMYLYIGFAQCLAMIPGVSRAGATIVAAMLLGADRRSASLDRGEDVSRLCAAPRLCAVRLVARGGRHARADRTGAGLLRPQSVARMERKRHPGTIAQAPRSTRISP
jgi:undecaprenyl-diphosphatase